MKDSYVSVTDLFCGAGGSSLGATIAGAEVRMAINHWPLAIRTHNTNFPNTDHDCNDISACDPRRYRSTRILIASPECTNHSLAKGVKRRNAQRDFFDNSPIDPAAERSRATMFDVCRFAEYHQYDIIIVENVVDVRSWVMWDAWLHAMHLLGYEHRAVYLNSMFCWPTPQSRDRIYVVFWRKGAKAPDLDVHPQAWCERCGAVVESVQSWKNPKRPYGKYRFQYVYRCPRCAEVVTPFYFCAANAIDWSLPAERIGDRKRPLKEKTLNRIRYGLQKFAAQAQLVSTNYFRPNVPLTAPYPTQTTGQQHAVIVPFLMDHVHSGTDADKSRSVLEAWRTQLGIPTQVLICPPFFTSLTHSDVERVVSTEQPWPTVMPHTRPSLVVPPFLADLSWTHGHDRRATGLDQPVPTQTAQQTLGMVIPPFIAELRRGAHARGVDEALATVTAGGGHHGVVVPPFLLSYYNNAQPQPLNEPMPTATPVDRHALTVPPFLMSYYTRSGAPAVDSLDEAMPTVPGRATHYLVHPDQVPSVDDCGFRMLQPHEVGAAMAFPATYIVHGTQRDQVRQYGQAVTPPAMQRLIERCVATLG